VVYSLPESSVLADVAEKGAAARVKVVKELVEPRLSVEVVEGVPAAVALPEFKVCVAAALA
jgi:hypothetical protein